MSAHPHRLHGHDSPSAGSRSYGLPTPPYSETTSSVSGSGSIGRDRKDSIPFDHHTSDRRDHSSRHLHAPISEHAASAQRRSSSSSSARTGSDTVGHQSPIQSHESSFRASRGKPPSGPTMTTDSAAPPASTSNGSLSRFTSAQRDSSAGRLSGHSSGDSPYVPRASSSLSTYGSTTSSPGERRKRRSEMHERDVSQIRSESRLGFGNGDDDETPINQQDEANQRHPFPRAAQHKYSPRKSTSLSVASSHYGDDTGSMDGDQQSPSRRASLRGQEVESPLTPTSAKSSRYAAPEEMPSGSMRRLVRTTGRSSARHSLDDRTSPSITGSTRSPMPAEFRLPDKEIRRAYRAAHQRQPSDQDDSDGSDAQGELASKATLSGLGDGTSVRSPASGHRDSLDGIQEEDGASSGPAQPRRRNYASEAATANEVATPLDYDGRLGTQGSRISVDSSSAQRFLNRGSQHSTPASSARRTPRSSEIGSPSEEARVRKISSTSSSRSQKSSSSASDLHRAASHVGMRKQIATDLFSADHRAHNSSAKTEHSSSSTTSSDPPRPYHDLPSRVDDAALDTLRNLIEDLQVGRAGAGQDRRQLPPLSLRTQAQSGPARSSLDLTSPAVRSVRPQSVMGLQRTPNDTRFRHVQQHPFTDPQRPRYDRSWQTPDPNNSSDAANRIHELVSLRAGNNQGQRQAVPPRSATAMGNASDNASIASPISDIRSTMPNSSEESAPIRNLATRLSQFEALYSKAPSADATTPAAAGPHTARTVELMGAIVKGTSTMWSELSSLHPIATEGHLMGRKDDALTEAFGQLDEGLAFVNKLVLEQARAIQDLLFLLDRTEKERQAQFNNALVEMGHSPRPFSRIGSGSAHASGGESNTHLLRRATSSVRGGSSLQTDSPSPFTRPSRGTGSAERYATLTASQIRSMTSLGHASHGRSASELSPSSTAAQRRHERAALTQVPRNEAFQDSPLFARRSVLGRSLPSDDSNASATRPAPAFTPRKPRLSNPSVSNATASFQPVTASAASSVVDSSPETSSNAFSGAEQVESEGSTVGHEYAEVDELGRVVGGGGAAGGETVRLSSRSQRATIRGGPRVVDTLASQLDTLRISDTSPVEQRGGADLARTSSNHSSSNRRHTINFHTAAEDPSRPPPQLSQYGLTKTNPPPRPPRHIQRPSEESISSSSPSRTRQKEEEPSTPGTPKQADRGQQEDGLSAVRSLGRTAARRVSRVLGSGQ